ncbi:MAG: hypothetical protein PHX60_03345 [Giesbergeria sp.]|uniref:hypothetical protein n=1 Tax=Giesbergeria sp. TaxID=2818473 RepID=UPI00262082F6|nr:hypothetical protein [Giesbergeria sp.]MDD2608716.1 hypothetical protein [Giesbergeria sp.]
MGLFSFVASCCSAIGSAISSAVSSIGSALSSFATTIGPVLGSIIDALKPVAEALGRFANAFLQGLGIIQPHENVEDMGERALQAAGKGITMEKFENFDGYMDALRKFELDPEVSSKRSSAEKLVAGLGVGTIGVEDKFNAERGSLNGIWALPMTNPSYFTPERMQGLVSAGRLGGDVFAYLEKRLGGAESNSFRKDLEMTPEGQPMNKQQLGTLYDALDDAREQWASIAKQMQEKNNPTRDA